MKNQFVLELDKNNSISISNIGNKLFLLEGDIEEAKIISEFGLSDVISCIDIKNGPTIAVGHDFNGYGIIDSICALKTDPYQPLLLKIQLV